MSSMDNLQSFTKALTAFCFIVFIYFFIPESFSRISDLLQYIIIVATIVILMLYYNKVLGDLPLTESSNQSPSLTSDIVTVDSKSNTKDLYENLTSLVITTTRSINPNCRSAIYIINPEKQIFTLQAGKASEFADSISGLLPNGKKPYISQLGSALGAHMGPGGLGVGIITK